MTTDNSRDKGHAMIGAAPGSSTATSHQGLKFASLAVSLILGASGVATAASTKTTVPVVAASKTSSSGSSSSGSGSSNSGSSGSGSGSSNSGSGSSNSGSGSLTSGKGSGKAAPVPEGLKGVPVPTPSNLSEFVADKSAAIRLGKALFWDMQVGSDGKTACATCHFHAGADTRHKNAVDPGLPRMASVNTPNPDTTFQLGGPNYEFKTSDFPFHKLADINNRDSNVVSSVNEIAGSQGVHQTRFVGVTPGAREDERTVVPDPVFHVGSANTRRVTGRNAPTMINAVFNFRNFWDGRAQYLFNGENPFGARDTNARVFKSSGSAMSPVQIRIDNASLASQASGPPGNDVEMSAIGRNLSHIGKRLLPARPLAFQQVARDDSSLGSFVHSSGMGLNSTDYAALVKQAFQPQWWNSAQAVQVDAAGNRSVIPMPGSLAANQFTQMQANFSLFFGLAQQMYMSTLVGDDTPFDQYMSGKSSALTSSQRAGMSVFFGKGKCANCHGGAEFTNASVRMTKKEPLQRMVMGNGQVAVYDEGFYNTAVTKTLEDIINGGKDPFGKPLANTAIAQQFGSAGFEQMIGIKPNITVNPGERIAVNGAAKTPTVRNVELTGPFFHNGSALTLRQVVDFYNRGGNFYRNNIDDVDPDIEPLGLSESEKNQLVDFMMSLTDERVRFEKGPFDHPQLFVPFGHVGNDQAVSVDAWGQALDAIMEVPMTGKSGISSKSKLPKNFLGS